MIVAWKMGNLLDSLYNCGITLKNVLAVIFPCIIVVVACLENGLVLDSLKNCGCSLENGLVFRFPE